MTEEVPDNRRPTEATISGKDWLLTLLVSTANRVSAHDDATLVIPITLLVGGVVVTGELIGVTDYFNAMVQMAREAGAEFLLPMFEQPERALRDALLTDINVDTLDEVTYIHLRNARFFLSDDDQPVPDDAGVLWRGKITEVDGFFMGEIESDSYLYAGMLDDDDDYDEDLDDFDEDDDEDDG